MKKEKELKFRLDEQTYNALEREAERQDRPKAEIIRQCLKAFLRDAGQL